jgi:hypothetical protein
MVYRLVVSAMLFSKNKVVLAIVKFWKAAMFWVSSEPWRLRTLDMNIC